MPTSRTIAVVTGTRAEFGLLLPVMRAIEAHPRLRLQVIATGTHLTRRTWRDIPAAGLTIAAKVPMQKSGEVGHAADVAALSRGIAGLGRVFTRMKPDVVLVLGDRIEAFAAASAASIGGMCVAHLHGGDRAEGVADEAMRHAISKLSHLHFAATDQSARRLIRMGETARTVFNVGSPAADGLADVVAAPESPDLIVMQHPIGAEDAQESAWMQGTLAAVADSLASGGSCMILAPNSDPGSAGIRHALVSADAAVIEHLPRHAFLSQLKGCRAIVGNSSAGLIEAAILGVPCVNIGPRQGGRERPRNVIDCGYGRASVRRAIRMALSMKRSKLHQPYGDGRTGHRIARLLATMRWADAPPRKRNTY